MYWSRGLFLWMVQPKSRFRNLKRADGTTQEFVSGAFRVCKFQFCLLAKYFISVNSSSCSQITSARLGEISQLDFHIHFKDIGHMASSTKKSDDHETYSFCNTTSPAPCCKVLRSFNSALVRLGKRSFKNCWFVYWSRGLFLWMVQRKS